MRGRYTDRHHGIADVALSLKLQEELKYEAESSAQAESGVPDFLKAFQESGVWQVRFCLLWKE
jgi:hypothetical protein